ncbi:hypothetical protein CHK_2948 [Christensenella hongkongensis]|uniref:Uncharacterized protein n=1 Tax=Christensenella hongkongensis TaxID=270498 RepID=A0A0M2NGF8_9FIRM|nr:hypothetical protein CHK_2948 [Christensenella hongkongensis]
MPDALNAEHSASGRYAERASRRRSGSGNILLPASHLLYANTT